MNDKLNRDAARQIIRDAVHRRGMRLETRADADDDNRVKLVASSNEPDLRFIDTGEEFLFGNEILSHEPKHLNLDRIKSGLAPLLFNHDTNNLIGTIESARTKNKERLMADVRFSAEEDAQKRLRQVREGVLNGVSIGYRVHKVEEVIPNPIDNGFRTFKSVDTEIFEISLVPTPADASVGVGRSETAIMARSLDINETLADQLMRALKLGPYADDANKPSDIKPKADDDEDEDEERTETSPLLEDDAGEEEKTETSPLLQDDAGEEPRSANDVLNNTNTNIVIDEKEVAETDITTREETQMSDKKETVSAEVTTDYTAERQRSAELVRMGNEYDVNPEKVNEWLMAGRSPDSVAREILEMDRGNEVDTRGVGHIELSEKEAKRQSFSIVRATNAMLGRGQLDGFELEMNQEIAKRLGREAKGPMGFYVPTSVGVRQLVMDTPGDGPELVFERPGEFIELLRAKTRVVQLGAKIMSGLADKVTLPRRTSANSTSWINEADPTGVAQTTGSFDQVALSPRQLLSRTAASKQLLAVANYDVEQLIRDDFARSFAVAFDAAAISGSTNGPDPEGILNATGVTDDSTAGSGSIPTFAQMVTLETSVANANADDGALGYLTTPGVYGQLQSTESFANTAATIINQITGEVNGFRIERSSNVPTDAALDGVETGHSVIFGDWSQLILAEWGALEVLIDPFILKHRGLVEYNAIMLADVALRHPESFAFNSGARITAQ